MVYRGPTVHYRPPLGIVPTAADHAFVQSLSLLKCGVREMCKRLGERFRLGKPMARSTMYHHFRIDLLPTPRGRKPGMKTIQSRANEDLAGELQHLIAGAKARGASTKK